MDAYDCWIKREYMALIPIYFPPSHSPDKRCNTENISILFVYNNISFCLRLKWMTESTVECKILIENKAIRQKKVAKFITPRIRRKNIVFFPFFAWILLNKLEKKPWPRHMHEMRNSDEHTSTLSTRELNIPFRIYLTYLFVFFMSILSLDHSRFGIVHRHITSVWNRMSRVTILYSLFVSFCFFQLPSNKAFLLYVLLSSLMLLLTSIRFGDNP